MSNKKEIVYLNQAEASSLAAETNNGEWDVDQLTISKPPTKCKVTINNTVIIDDVYVHECKDGGYSLYNDYSIQKRGYYGMCCKPICWPVFCGKGLVLEFKSENYVIEYYE